MEFPRFVFKCPGLVDLPGGKSYGSVLVQNPAEHEAAIKAGYFSTLPEAISGKPAVSVQSQGQAKPAVPQGQHQELGKDKEAR